MNFFEKIENEHEKIEDMLIELETIINSKEINYPNLIHTLRELNSFLIMHEEGEEKLFRKLDCNGFKIPVKRINFEHGEFNNKFKFLTKALNTRSEFKIKDSLIKQGKEIIEMLREHMKRENWIIEALSWDDLSDGIKKEFN